MRAATILTLAAALVVVVGCGRKEPGEAPAAGANPEAEAAALAAAQAWLRLVDAGRYAESWDQAAQYFKGAVPCDQWGRTLEAVRGPLGNVADRQVAGTRYATALPGAPDGRYVVVQFKTRFEKKQSAVETVTPMCEEDGTWRVSGYYIK